MRLHLDERHETQMCLGLVIAVMILAGSAILYMGTHYQVATRTLPRSPLASLIKAAYSPPTLEPASRIGH